MSGDTIGASSGELGVRVGLLEKRDIDIEKQVNAIRDTMATRSDIAAIAAQISAVNDKIEKRSEIPWQAWSVAAFVVAAVGGYPIWTINSAVNNLDRDVATVSENSVRTQRYNTDQQTQSKQFEAISARQLRDENKFLPTETFNVQHGDLKQYLSAEVANLQRQIDDNQRRLNEVWSARDALLDLRQRVERLEPANR